MSKSNHGAIRALLRENEDGLTTSQLAARMRELDPPIRTVDNHVSRALKEMPDSYVDRWMPASPAVWAAVWCVVVPPENCPKPDGPPNPGRPRKPRKPCPTTKPETA